MQVVPAIIAKTFEEVKQKLILLDGVSDWAQLDIMDGKFVLPTTWDVAEDLEMLPGRVKLEAHLMVNDPEEVLGEWMNYADRVIVHAESSGSLADLLEVFDGSPAKFSLALKIDTPLNVLEDYEGKIEHVQLMSIDVLGYHGGTFDEKIYERIKEVRGKYPALKISVDGGIALENAPLLMAAGADSLVVGSAIWDTEDAVATIKKFQAL